MNYYVKMRFPSEEKYGEKMNYVIYGAGYRGKRVLDYIGFENIHAFIDMDEEKQREQYCGKPVISLDEYMKKYERCFIVITPVFVNNIEEILEKNNIYQYINLCDLPSEFAGYGDCKFEDCYGKLKDDFNEKLYVYGINALGFLIYDFLCQNRDIFICAEETCKLEKIEWLKKYYPKIRLKKHKDIRNDGIILMSIAGQNENDFPNRIINLFEYANSNILYRNEKLLMFKDIYKKSKRCFIVATGPSLHVDDLHILTENNIFCFGVNSILKIKEEWVADAYVVSDSNFVSNNIKSIESYNCNLKFIGNSCKEYCVKEHNDSYKIHVVTSGSGIDFSEEIEQKIYGGYGSNGTVTYVCIQLAVYMGFSEIYLLGVDCNYVMGSKNNHFIAEEKEDNKDHKEDSMIKAYEYAKRYADTHGIKIYNATRGGMLEVFKRVDFDSLFEDKK